MAAICIGMVVKFTWNASTGIVRCTNESLMDNADRKKGYDEEDGHDSGSWKTSWNRSQPLM